MINATSIGSIQPAIVACRTLYEHALVTCDHGCVHVRNASVTFKIDVHLVYMYIHVFAHMGFKLYVTLALDVGDNCNENC